MTNRTLRLEDFCLSYKCGYYDYVSKFKSKPHDFMSDLERYQLDIAKSQCKKNCSAYRLYRWLKERGIEITSNLD